MTPKPLNTLFDAMHHGKHLFDDFLALDVANNYERIGWKNRTIYRPSNKLKVFQSFLNHVLFEHLEINKRVSFAYRKGTTLRQAVEVHAFSRVFYQSDFEKFFESLDADLVRRSMMANVTPVSDLKDYVDRIIDLTTIEGRLPIGFVTSPAISNACLKPFDDHLEQICNDRHLVYTRYADDIVISTVDQEQLEDIDAVISELARTHIHPRLTLNTAKRKLTRVGRRIQILGFDILPTGRVTIRKEVRRKVEHLIHTLVSDKARFEKLYDGDLNKGLQHLGGFISHIHSADPLLLAKLRKKFGTTLMDALLHRSLSNEAN